MSSPVHRCNVVIMVLSWYRFVSPFMCGTVKRLIKYFPWFTLYHELGYSVISSVSRQKIPSPFLEWSNVDVSPWMEHHHHLSLSLSLSLYIYMHTWFHDWLRNSYFRKCQMKVTWHTFSWWLIYFISLSNSWSVLFAFHVHCFLFHYDFCSLCLLDFNYPRFCYRQSRITYRWQWI